jgi:hypothetical protein
MKLSDLKQLIKEELENITKEEYTPEDEIGKFFVVRKPGTEVNKEEMVYEATVFHPIEMKETLGVYKNRIDAKRHAAEALKNYETQLEEVKSAMEEFRKSKAEIDEKKKAAKEKIEKMK